MKLYFLNLILQAIQTLLYFGSVIAILYYFGIIQFILRQMAWVMQFTLGTTAAESLNAAGCVFLGMTEGPLMIRPYFSKMTASELHTVFASGFACVAGSLFVAYIAFGVSYFFDFIIFSVRRLELESYRATTLIFN